MFALFFLRILMDRC